MDLLYVCPPYGKSIINVVKLSTSRKSSCFRLEILRQHLKPNVGQLKMGNECTYNECTGAHSSREKQEGLTDSCVTTAQVQKSFGAHNSKRPCQRCLLATEVHIVVFKVRAHTYFGYTPKEEQMLCRAHISS